tara:strand:+ start:239 stop:412 length:174 start_codon:yes stop_codon:yes gene_type:complete
LKIKNISLNGLTKRQMQAMKRHSKHHTTSHIDVMVKAIRKGKTFGESHNLAMKKVGK